MKRPFRVVATLAVLVTTLVACGDDGGDGKADGAGGDALTGLILITAGECAEGGVTAGSWFRMVEPDGTPQDGPFVENGDSPCGDVIWTPLSPGGDGGLRLGAFQPNPDPAFDDNGNALAATITEPVAWFGVQFSVSTNETDPQTGTAVQAPSLALAADGTLNGDLAAVSAGWNEQHFNQGAPKPGGSRPGNTSGPRGTYDPATGAITVEWTSQIVGGPFDRFTGVWRLEGTLETA